MREFSADYLRYTRAGMWVDSREALDPLSLADRERVLDVGCGSGALTRVLAEELETGTGDRGEQADVDDDARSDDRDERRGDDDEHDRDDESGAADESGRVERRPGARIVGCDADRRLLSLAREHAPVITGDATQLPFVDDGFDLVVCQALLINLPDPTLAIGEFARVSSDLVVAIEPDNGAVRVESSVGDEGALARRAREAFLDGVETDVALGEDGARAAFASAGVEVLETRRYDHVSVVEAPYEPDALAAARRKASGAGLADDRDTMLAGDLSVEGYDELRGAWREMGREVIEQMQSGSYRRREVVPVYVTVGRST